MDTRQARFPTALINIASIPGEESKFLLLLLRLSFLLSRSSTYFGSETKLIRNGRGEKGVHSDSFPYRQARNFSKTKRENPTIKMGLWRMWSRWKDRFHAPHESDREAADRLSTTPPEFWRPKDWITSRRLRHQRQISIQNAVRKGGNPARVAQKYPEGPFWPRTPQWNEDILNDMNDARIIREAEEILFPGMQIFQDENGILCTVHPDTGEPVALWPYLV